MPAALPGDLLAVVREHLAIGDDQVAFGARQRRVSAESEGAELVALADQRSPTKLTTDDNRLRIRAHGQARGVGRVLETKRLIRNRFDFHGAGAEGPGVDELQSHV